MLTCEERKDGNEIRNLHCEWKVGCCQQCSARSSGPGRARSTILEVYQIRDVLGVEIVIDRNVVLLRRERMVNPVVERMTIGHGTVRNRLLWKALAESTRSFLAIQPV